jgi:60 kDa SS-A/Ro ribonucleoprotein
MSYLRSALGPVPQSEPLPGMVPNSAGGHAYAADDWKRLERFLILGSEGGSYYAGECEITMENLDAVRRCIAADGARVVRTIVDVSSTGRAPKNDPAILALALCAKTGNDATRQAAFQALPDVCRIGTHLYHFAAFVNELGGWGRGTKRAVARWFNDKAPSDLAYQLVKYQSRDGWSSRDLLRLSHPTPKTVDHASLFAWACGKAVDGTPLPGIVDAFERAKRATNATEVVREIRDHNLPRECVPTQFLTDPQVWDALAHRMPLTAMIRNLATMTRVGLLKAGGQVTENVAARIVDPEALTKSRVHPLAVLVALETYQQGHGERGSSTWTPLTRITDALDAAFYASFGNVEPTGKRLVLALDVSSSMNCGTIAGMPGITPRVASVAMAMITAAVEPKVTICGFSTTYVGLDVSPRRRLDDNIRAIDRLPFGGTDCALPITHADAAGGEVDTFVVYTDSETGAGPTHPSAALKKYRRRVPDAKLAVVGMVANKFTIADPTDPGMLDVVGFDTATPQVLSSFSRGM